MKKDPYANESGKDRFGNPLKDAWKPATEEEMIDAVARAELIDEIPDYESGWCLDPKTVPRRKGAIRTWLDAHRDKEPFRAIYREELRREKEKKDPRFSPLTRAIDRFRKEHKRSISQKTARRYLKEEKNKSRRNNL